MFNSTCWVCLFASSSLFAINMINEVGLALCGSGWEWAVSSPLWASQYPPPHSFREGTFSAELASSFLALARCLVSEAISESSLCDLTLGQWGIARAFSFLRACPEMNTKEKRRGCIPVSFGPTDPFPRYYFKNNLDACFYEYKIDTVSLWRLRKQNKKHTRTTQSRKGIKFHP